MGRATLVARGRERVNSVIALKFKQELNNSVCHWQTLILYYTVIKTVTEPLHVHIINIINRISQLD